MTGFNINSACDNKKTVLIKKGEIMKTLKYGTFLVLFIFLVGCEPTAQITTPKDNEIFEGGGGITFSGSATDLTEGILNGDSLFWTSDIDGKLGTGNGMPCKKMIFRQVYIELN